MRGQKPPPCVIEYATDMLRQGKRQSEVMRRFGMGFDTVHQLAVAVDAEKVAAFEKSKSAAQIKSAAAPLDGVPEELTPTGPPIGAPMPDYMVRPKESRRE